MTADNGGFVRMTTVREVRVALAAEVIQEQIAMGNLHPAEPRSELRSKAHVTLVANHLIDVLFPDHVFDDVEIPAASQPYPPRLRGH